MKYFQVGNEYPEQPQQKERDALILSLKESERLFNTLENERELTPALKGVLSRIRDGKRNVPELDWKETSTAHHHFTRATTKNR